MLARESTLLTKESTLLATESTLLAKKSTLLATESSLLAKNYTSLARESTLLAKTRLLKSVCLVRHSTKPLPLSCQCITRQTVFKRHMSAHKVNYLT